MNSRDLAHEEDRKALRSLERRPWIIIAIAIVAVMAASGIVYGIVNQHSDAQTRQLTQQVRQQASAAQRYSQADCGTWHDLTLIPPTTGASVSGLKLWAGFRNSYVHKGCVAIKGPVPPVDPRLLPYLDPGVS